MHFLSQSFLINPSVLTWFRRRPWVQGQPWKVLEFQKTEKKSLNCFGKRVEGLEKFGICLSWTFQDLVTVRTSCHSFCKAGRRTAWTILLLINIVHECLKSVCLFSDTGRAVCCRMIDWKKDVELALNYWMKRLWKASTFFRTSASGILCSAQEGWLVGFNNTFSIYMPYRAIMVWYGIVGFNVPLDYRATKQLWCVQLLMQIYSDHRPTVFRQVCLSTSQVQHALHL